MTEWLQPFFILSPALFVGCVANTKVQPVRGGYIALISAAGVLLLGYTIVMLANVANAGQKMNGIIPFSNQIGKIWQQRYGTPVSYVGGEYLAEWLTFYTPSRPKIITPWSNTQEPNIYNAQISLADIRRSGVMLIGKSEGECSDASFKKARAQWPQLQIDAISQITFRLDNKHDSYPLCIGFVDPVLK